MQQISLIKIELILYGPTLFILEDKEKMVNLLLLIFGRVCLVIELSKEIILGQFLLNVVRETSIVFYDSKYLYIMGGIVNFYYIKINLI